MDPKTLDEHCGDAAKLAEVVLLNCKGKVDNFLPGYLECAVHRLVTKTKKNSLRVLLLEVVRQINYIYINIYIFSYTSPSIALAIFLSLSIHIKFNLILFIYVY